MIQIAKPEEISPAEVEKEILNPIVYTELKFRGWTDLQIMDTYNINNRAIHEFKKRQGFIRKWRSCIRKVR